MSHIVEIKTQVKDVAAAQAACQRLRLEPAVQGSARLFSGTAAGLIVKLPGWRYPAVFNVETGEACFDNYSGRWGDRAELDKFLAGYATEKIKIEARRRGHSCTEQQLADGSIKVTISVGGAA